MLISMQGFDKYGVWRIDAVPAPNLREALSLKVPLLAPFFLEVLCVAHCSSILSGMHAYYCSMSIPRVI